jgi:hypothetical protein
LGHCRDDIGRQELHATVFFAAALQAVGRRGRGVCVTGRKGAADFQTLPSLLLLLLLQGPADSFASVLSHPLEEPAPGAPAVYCYLNNSMLLLLLLLLLRLL